MRIVRFLVAFLAVLSSFLPAVAIENEQEAPAAFVEGTRDYVIPYMEKTLFKLFAYFSEEELIPFARAISDVKNRNAILVGRIKAIRENKSVLHEKDADFLSYREALARTTDIMFGLLRKLNDRTALPPR